MHFLNQRHAEDVILWHRYNYYVLGKPLVEDAEYDAMERGVCALWSVCVCGIGGCVGSDNAWDYPAYIQEGRRPNKQERKERDRLIAARWMAYLCNG